MMAATVALLLAALALAAPALAQPPPRDVGRTPPAGIASITGIVVSDEREPKPLRRARVMLNGPQLQVGRTVISNDDGSFAFERLPAGLYTVGAAKQAYITMNYGARRTGRAGTSVVLGESESRSLTLRLPRGAVIAGMVTDEQGLPAAGVAVSAMTYKFVGRERRLVPAGLTTSPSDDRGAYRVFGLPAGEYVIIAQLRQTGPQTGDLQVLSAEEVRRALEDLRDSSARAQPGRSSASKSAPPEPRSLVTVAPVFYPGSPNAAQASMVKVGAGEERAGIDFQLRVVPTATVSGVLSSRAGISEQLMVLLSPGDGPTLDGYRGTAVPSDAEGRFQFSRIPPGLYVIIARSMNQKSRSDAPASVAAPPMQWASTEVLVQGQDVTDIALTLQPGLTLSGRVVFEGTTPAPKLTALRVPLLASRTVGAFKFPEPVLQLEPDGRFATLEFMPGLYRQDPEMPGVRSALAGWWLKSIVLRGRDILDTALDLQQSADEIVMTLSDRASELAGGVIDPQGKPQSDHFVIVFGADRTSWFFGSRRVVGIRPDANGRYTIRNLPAGDYFILAFDDVEQGEWFDPALLERLLPGATRITLGEYEKKQQDLVVGR
jgi:hypothetical protein